MNSDLQEMAFFHSLMNSLDCAFLDRQAGVERSPEEWGERFFTTLEQEHAQWNQDLVSVYATARQLLFESLILRHGVGFGYSLYRRPEGFLRTVLALLGEPTYSPN